MQRKDLPVVFATPGKGKETIVAFEAFLRTHHGDTGRIREVNCDISAAFLAALQRPFQKPR